MKTPRTSGLLAVVLLLVLAAGPSFGRGRSSHPSSAGRRAFWRHSGVHGGCACSSCHESQADVGAEQ